MSKLDRQFAMEGSEGLRRLLDAGYTPAPVSTITVHGETWLCVQKTVKECWDDEIEEIDEIISSEPLRTKIRTFLQEAYNKGRLKGQEEERNYVISRGGGTAYRDDMGR